MPLAEDTILEQRYRIDSTLAQHEGGAIYRGFDLNLKTPVVIKEKYLDNVTAINQFKQEALILSGLRHPMLPAVIQNFSVNDQQYVVMDFIAGADLGEFVGQGRSPLAERHALECMSQLCRGVSYLHHQKPPILHRDIKPHNIKFSPGGGPILLDLGIAKTNPTEPNLAAYLSPEQRTGQPLSPASDIFSLGATLYAIITGQTPPEGPALAHFDPAENQPLFSPKTAQAIAQAMQPEPAKRPQTVEAWQTMLAEALREAALAPWSAVSAPPVVAPAKPAQPVAKADQATRTGPAKSFWLVNPAGVGYLIESEKFTIGSGPEANIRLEEPTVAPAQVQVRRESDRCMIRQETGLGRDHITLLNDQRLGSGWYPLVPSDILVVGNTRLHLTTAKPAKTASSKPVAPIKPAETAPPAGTPTPPLPAASTGRATRSLLIVSGIVLLLIVVTSLIVYFLGDDLSQPTGASSEVAAATISTVPPAGSETEISLPPTNLPASPTTETVAAALEDAPTDAPSPTSTATEPATANLVEEIIITPTLEPESLSTPTVTTASAITGTASQPIASPTAAGPTPIPLVAEQTIAQIGAVEVIDVDFNPKNPEEVYALVKKDGLYKSISEGAWLKLPVDASGVTALAIDPTNPIRLYAPTWNAVLISEDGGNSWQAGTTGLSGSNRTVDVVAVDPVEPDRLYAGVGETLVISTDGGQSWQAAGSGLGVSKIHSIVVDPFNHTVIYVGGLAGSIYKSEDSGATFVQLPGNIGQGAFGMVANPRQPDELLVGINSSDAGIVKTENGLEFSSASAGLIYGGADSAYSALAYAPSNPNIIYAGSGYEDNLLAKGIFKSSNGGENWVPISSTLPLNPDTRQPYYVKAIAVSPTDPNTVFAATGGGLYQSRDGGASWQLR